MHVAQFQSLLWVLVHRCFCPCGTHKIGVLYPSGAGDLKQIRVAVRLAAQVAEEAARTEAISNNSFAPAPVRLFFNDTAGDRVKAAQSLAWMAQNHVEAVVGPAYSSESLVTSPFATEYSLPLVSYSAEAPSLSQKSSHPYFFRTCPSLTLKLRAVAAICRFYGWRRLALVYVADAYGEALLNLMALADAQELEVVTQHALPADGSFVYANKKIQPSKSAIAATQAIQEKQAAVVVMALYAPGIQKLMNAFMTQGMQHGMAYLTLEMDIQALQDAVTATYFEGAIGLRAFQVSTPLMEKFLTLWKTTDSDTYPTIREPLSEYVLFAADAVFALVWAMRTGGSNFVGKERRSLVQRTVTQGLSGMISFSKSQDRIIDDVDVELMNLQGDSFVSFGRCISANMSIVSSSAAIFPGRTTTVPTDLRTPPKALILVPDGPPFQILERTLKGDRLSKACYTGVLLGRMADKIRRTHAFEYEVVLWPGSYTGMLREVARNKSYSMAAGDITITAARSQFVEFSQPYYATDVSIIYRKHMQKYNPLKFAFLAPLSESVWIAWVVTVLVGSHFVWLTELGSLEFPRNYRKAFINILWLAGSSVFSTIHFRATNGVTRVLLFAWFCATLLLVTTYTASLTTALVSEGTDPTKGIEELTSQKLGCTSGVAVCEYLVHRGFKIHKEVTQEQGPSAVQNGDIDYYPGDTPWTIEFIAGKCDELMLLPETLYDSLFGFAFRPGNGMKELVDKAFIELWDSRELEDLNIRYLPKDTCKTKKERLSGVTMQHVGDVFALFAIIAIGCVLYTFVKWFRLGHLPHDQADKQERILEAANDMRLVSSQISHEISNHNEKLSMLPSLRRTFTRIWHHSHQEGTRPPTHPGENDIIPQGPSPLDACADDSKQNLDRVNTSDPAWLTNSLADEYGDDSQSHKRVSSSVISSSSNLMDVPSAEAQQHSPRYRIPL